MKSLPVLFNQDIFDIVNKISYGLDNVYKLIRENPFIDSVDFDFNDNPGRSIEYDETFKYVNAQVLIQQPQSVQNGDVSIQAQNNQTTFDLALMSIGLDNFVKLLVDNQLPSINDMPVVGKVFNFNLKDIKDRGFYNQKLVIVTGDIPYEQYLLVEDGGFLLQENGEKIILEL